MDKKDLSLAGLFIILIIALVVADIVLNKDRYDLSSGIAQQAENANANQIITVENSNLNGTSTGDHVLTAGLLAENGLANTSVEDAKSGKDLFGLRLETLDANITKSYLLQDNFPIGFVYQMDSKATYEEIKKLLTEKLSASPVWKLSETNTFGTHSFYLNNSNRADTVFVFIQYSSTIIGFEYPKTNHPKFEPLLENLKNLF